ncbi:laccase-2 [Pseudomassariella vexata]|uniref:laccase n=1 Tax=Pseudomassariella vexata TaxID=1141098 RepID=A0A1Y2E1S3_9PEZI|nr:laccase-2 [Pseudomassariella vexata]ORY65459.1 laccase-2 [Pseudomassariella vexata]
MFGHDWTSKLVVGLSLATLATSNPVAAPQATTTITPSGPPCTHSATNRACWRNGFNITTDYETSLGTPPGITRVYNLVITNVSSFSPDGVSKPAMLINVGLPAVTCSMLTSFEGTFPGPLITADWGDFLQINVHNNLPQNGTSIHWHGMRQLGTNDQDGVNGVTECPIPPNHVKSYTFRATQYGTSWYHSHFSAQYGNGVLGPMQINGPASANYDIDLGPYVISDWYRTTADEAASIAEIVTNGAPPASSNVLFNGTNINPSGSGGQYNRVTLTPGRKHRLRLINTSVENHFSVSLVGHNFTVISTDMVAIEPLVASSLFMAVGQRYDVIIESNQNVDSYWFNATLVGGLCGVSVNTAPAAIFSYQGAPAAGVPSDPGVPLTTTPCIDNTGFVPIVPRQAPQSEFAASQDVLDIQLETTTVNSTAVFRWEINGESNDVKWDKPTLEYVRDGDTSYPPEANVIILDEPDVWTFWVVQNNAIIPHPIHLHGHDFLLLGTSDTDANPTEPVIFNEASDIGGLNFNNPTRRDVAMLPPFGWLVIAWKTDNPGAWLVHCHIAWHVSQDLSVQFLEMRDQIPKAMDLGQLEPQCSDWEAYYETSYWKIADSGL